MRIQNPQGLAAGNISISWNPATEAVTIHRLQIRRGDKIIDVLASGQTFQTLRRETNLEAAMLDGTLTANIQPEGLQEGDIVDLATTTEHSDPALKGHVEAIFAGWNGAPINLAHASANWPKSMNLTVRRSDGLPQPRTNDSDERRAFDLTATKVEPLISPTGAPARFKTGRIAEASDFQSWSDLADLFTPLFRDAAAIPSSGPLHDEVERIRGSAADPKSRAEAALDLVQDRIRYVALLMGQGSYVPTPADTTWSRRFGDCKAKTALLLGILHSLQIEAEPVLVNSGAGDAIADRLPMAQWFNHVLVRAHIGGKDYWLDGTRTGDTEIDSLETPNFGWVLPLVAKAKLVHLLPSALDRPNGDLTVDLDASKGALSPVSATATNILRGDAAVGVDRLIATLSSEQQHQFYDRYWRGVIDFVEPSTMTGKYDQVRREYRLEMTGTATLRWIDGRLSLPTTNLGYRPNFKRPVGPNQEAPIAVDFPAFEKHLTTIRVPPGFFASRNPGTYANVSQTLAGVEFRRTSTVNGDVLTIESSARSLVPEITYKEALADEEPIRALFENSMALSIPNSYRPTATDLDTMSKVALKMPEQFLRRGQTFSTAQRFEEAVKDFNEVIRLEPKNLVALSNRSVANAWLGRKDEALQDVQAALAIDPNHHTALRAQAQVLEKLDNCAEAIKVYSKVLETEPTDQFSRDHRAQCAIQENNQKLALSDSAAMLRANPALPNARLRRALALIDQKNYGLAAEQARLLESQNPDQQWPHLAASRIYRLIDQKTEALQAINRALVIAPNADAYVERALLMNYNGREAPLADLEEALALDPNNAGALEFKGKLLFEEGRIDEAANLFEKAAAAQPASIRLQIMALAARLKSSAPGPAHEKLKALRSTLSKPRDLNSLCELEAQAGVVLKEAEADCNTALQTSPNTPDSVGYLGLVYLKQKRFVESIAAYSRAIDLKASWATYYLGRAFAYRGAGEAEKAEADRAKALALADVVDRIFAAYGLKW